MATTEVILYERIKALGNIGDIVKVRGGYARNYLLPLGKAVRNNKKNRAFFEEKKQQILADNLKKQQDASVIDQLINDKELIVIVNTSDSGQLYGSVNSSMVVSKIAELGAKISRNSVLISRPFKSVGIYEIELHLHSEVVSKIRVNIARSEQEALDQRNAGVIGVAEEFFAKKKSEAEAEEKAKKAAKEAKKDNKQDKPASNDSTDTSKSIKDNKQSKSASNDSADTNGV